MAELEFEPDVSELSEVRSLRPYMLDPALLEQTCLLMPVRLRIGGVELLGEMSSRQGSLNLYDLNHQAVVLVQGELVLRPWRELPIINVASVGLQHVRDAIKFGSSRWFVPNGGDIRFNLREGELYIESSLNGRQGHEPWQKVLGVFERFASEVRQFLANEIPELIEHPYWREWFPTPT